MDNESQNKTVLNDMEKAKARKKERDQLREGIKPILSDLSKIEENCPEHTDEPVYAKKIAEAKLNLYQVLEVLSERDKETMTEWTEF